MQRADFQWREQLAREGTLSGGYNDRMAALHREQNKRLRIILAQHGWPGRSLIADDGAKAAWLILQHTILDPVLMREAMSLMERSVRERDTEPSCLALLIDRIRTLEGKPQFYGSQYDWDEAAVLNPMPIEDKDNVDIRRSSVGPEPWHRGRRSCEPERHPRATTPPKTIGPISASNANGQSRLVGSLTRIS